MNTQKGFTHIILIILLGLIVLVSAAYYIQNKKDVSVEESLQEEVVGIESDVNIDDDYDSKDKDDNQVIDNTPPAEPEPVFCTADAMLCPDGSYVGRSAPGCQFRCPTPVENSKEIFSGIIKSVYYRDGKKYLEIDYIEWNPNWKAGGASDSVGPSYYNNNPTIRTFEISEDARFSLTNPEKNLSFSEFKIIFDNPNNYQVLNPWDIVITGEVIIEITEHFLS